MIRLEAGAAVLGRGPEVVSWRTPNVRGVQGLRWGSSHRAGSPGTPVGATFRAGPEWAVVIGGDGPRHNASPLWGATSRLRHRSRVEARDPIKQG